MDFDNFLGTKDDRFSKLESSRIWPILMRKVYTWMTLALTITGVVAYGISTSERLMLLLYGNTYTFWGLLIAELGIIFYLSLGIEKLSLTSATMWFILFALVNGLTLGWVFIIYTEASIAQTFFITAGTFASMAIIGSTTKKDLTKMGGVLFMALIGLIIAGLVNMFFKSSKLDLIISGIGVFIFTGLTAWDVQKIKRMAMEATNLDENVQKIALLGSLTLYLDFINLFLKMLRFLGKRK